MFKIRWIGLAGLIALFGCGSPVPSGMFLTMSVSTRDVAVETSINGKQNEFLSSDSGSMTGSIPLNKFVREGSNTATFTLSPVDTGDAADPAFLATLEISLKGEIVDTLTPGERSMFSRNLSAHEIQSLLAGESVTITETFEVNNQKLAALKNNGG